MTKLFLSRVQLRRDAVVAALAPLLIPPGGTRVAASHHLAWALFSDGPNRRRDFLWREEEPGRFMTLSARPPNPLNLFDIQSRPFEPNLSRGDRLGFVLRANAVVARKAQPGAAPRQRGKRHDVVMDALKDVPRGARAEARLPAVDAAGRGWLERQGAAHGFTPEPGIGVNGYDRVAVDRGGDKPAVFGVIDLAGVVRVDDPASFVAALAAGFGRARAYGYGLMLIRRMPPRDD